MRRPPCFYSSAICGWCGTTTTADWKGYQRQFVLLETEVTQAGLATAQGEINQAELVRLQTERAAAEQSVASNQTQIDELQGQLDTVEAELYRVSQAWQFTKAEYDVARYGFERSCGITTRSMLKKSGPRSMRCIRSGSTWACRSTL